MPRPQFTLRALLVAMLVVALMAWEVGMAMRPPSPPTPGQVIGHVDMDAVPLPDAQVEFSVYRGRGAGNLREVASTDKAGDFALSLPPGTYHFSVRPFAYFGLVERMPRLCRFAEEEGRVVVTGSKVTKLSLNVHERDR